MVKLMEAECPNCGAMLKVPKILDMDFSVKCEFCGKNVIITKDDGYDEETESKVVCPLCKGEGHVRCRGIENFTVSGFFRSYELFVEGCAGDGKCMVYCSPPKLSDISNYCRDGKCAWCKGTGRYFGECKFCGGTGNCRFCYGTGRCKFCNGRGVVECKLCRGTGLKR